MYSRLLNTIYESELRSSKDLAFSLKKKTLDKTLILVEILEKFTIGINWKSILHTQCGSNLGSSYNEINF